MAANNDDVAQKVVEAVDALEASEDFLKLEIELSSGVRLKLKPVSKHFIYGVTATFEPPQVPLVHIDGKKRPIENPDDPDYQEAVDHWIADVANASTDVVLLRGTEILFKPDDLSGPDDPDWIEELEVLDVPLIENKRARYLFWLKAIAAPTDDDIRNLMEALGRLTGVSESDVADAVERFRDIAARARNT